VVAIVVAVLALLAGGTVLAVQAKLFTPSHPVPSLLGKTVPQGRLAVTADKFTVRTTGHASSITVGPGLILSQRPTPRSGGHVATAKQGSTIGVVVSTGPPPVAIPALTSFTSCADAVAALKAIHLVGVCPATAQQYSSTVVAGAVLGSVPTGTAPYGSTVTVVTSKGHAPVAIPAVTGSTSSYTTAAAALTAAGFVPQQNNEYSSTVPTGQVIGTTPDPSTGPQPFGSKVSVNISLGPQPVIIPNVVGQSVSQATSALTALGLKVGGPYGPPGATTVLSTDPAAGTSVQAASTTVNIYTL
jgi:serine/threonine-protein kinase